MTPKEKKAFVKKMREAKEAKAKERKKSKKNWKNPIRQKIDPKKLEKVKSDIRSYEKIHEEYFKEYKRLGGKKTREEYNKNMNKFTYHTLDIFVFGDPIMYNSRDEALEAVKNDAKIDNKELNLIFKSIDNITGYT